MSVTIEAIEYALPERRVTNQELRERFPSWDMDRLEQRTGVLARHIASAEETALDFAYEAAARLSESKTLQSETIDAVLFCTQTPDYIMPPNACLLQERLGLRKDIMALDFSLACSGYVYGLRLARDLMGGGARRVLLATADTYSRLINPQDRATFCLFGDGGAVSIIGPAERGKGILDIRCGTSGKEADRFMVPAGGARIPRTPESAVIRTDAHGNQRSAEQIVMNGMGVLSFFNSVVPDEVKAIVTNNGLTLDDVDVFVFHQASRIALQSIQRALGLPAEKMIEDLAEGGNLVSASIPVVLKNALDRKRIVPGNLVLLCGFGVGLSWGTALVRF